MTDDVVIRAVGLSKKYKIGHESESERYTALRDVIGRKAKNILRTTSDILRGRAVIAGDRTEEFWALKDLNFEIRRGEVVGIVGRNGAGKSTLLKILSRITEPSKGRAEIHGRVASLLEVGTGFHPELTGRENIHLNGAILGMSRAEVRRKFDEIVAFAEVERFLDTPVKRYSSGMYVRLAFAVAAHLEPEILVVDEVLAVGDVQFQKKCLGKMRDVATHGRTILFVNHNMAALEQLTQSAILLREGNLILQGRTPDVVAAYLGADHACNAVVFDVEKTPRKFIGNKMARFIQLRFDRKTPVFYLDEDLEFVARVRAYADIDAIRTSMTVFAQEGSPVGNCFGPHFANLKRGETVEFRISLPRPCLAPGNYYCGVAIGKGDHTSGPVEFDVVLDTLAFEVRSQRESGTLPRWEKGWGHVIFSPLNQQIVRANGEPPRHE